MFFLKLHFTSFLLSVPIVKYSKSSPDLRYANRNLEWLQYLYIRVWRWRVIYASLKHPRLILWGKEEKSQGIGECVKRKLLLGKRLKNFECQVVVRTKFCMTTPTIFCPSVCNLLLVILLPTRILKLFLDFWKKLCTAVLIVSFQQRLARFLWSSCCGHNIPMFVWNRYVFLSLVKDKQNGNRGRFSASRSTEQGALTLAFPPMRGRRFLFCYMQTLNHEWKHFPKI